MKRGVLLVFGLCLIITVSMIFTGMNDKKVESKEIGGVGYYFYPSEGEGRSLWLYIGEDISKRELEEAYVSSNRDIDTHQVKISENDESGYVRIVLDDYIPHFDSFTLKFNDGAEEFSVGDRYFQRYHQMSQIEDKEDRTHFLSSKGDFTDRTYEAEYSFMKIEKEYTLIVMIPDLAKEAGAKAHIERIEGSESTDDHLFKLESCEGLKHGDVTIDVLIVQVMKEDQKKETRIRYCIPFGGNSSKVTMEIR